MLSLTSWKLRLHLLERLGIGEAHGEAWSWILISISSHLCRKWTSLPMVIDWLYLFGNCLCAFLTSNSYRIIFFLLIWVKLLDKNTNWESYVLQIFFPIWRLSFFVVYFLPYGNSTSMSTNVSIFSYGFWVLGHVLKDLPQFRNINVCSCLSSNFMAAYFISKYFVHLKFILISKLFVVVSASFPEQSIFFFYWDVKSLSWTKFQDAFSFISVLIC